MELNIAIVDDTLPDVLRLEIFIQNYFYGSGHKLNEIVSYSSGEEILKNFAPKMFQIVFMDIIMDNLNGVETSRQLRNEDAELLIIFMTTSKEYAFDAFHVHPFDYILKPYGKKDVDKVLDEAVLALTSDDPMVTIKVAHSEYAIPIRLISSAVSQGHGVEINLTDGRRVLSNMKFKEIEQIFLGYENFLLCNRGIIVNMFHISSQENGIFTMKDGARYPIRVKDQPKLKAEFSKFLIKNMRAEIIKKEVYK